MRFPVIACICLVIIFGTFTTISAQTFIRTEVGFPVAHAPANVFADLDNDGDMDAFVAGLDEFGVPMAGVYLNNGGVFTLVSALEGVSEAACAIGDYNNDGLADLAVCGMTATSPSTKIYRNDGGGSFTDVGAGIAGVSGGGIDWGDYNNDGWADLLISGTDADGVAAAMLYTNDEEGGFVQSGISFTGLSGGGVAWSDIDNDEDLDFAIIGTNTAGSPETIVYINDGDAFSPMGAGIQGLMASSVSWGDFNDDAYPDLLITGATQSNTTLTAVYRNTTGNSFAAIAESFEGVSFGSGIWGDFDNDGRLDLVVAGQEIEDNGGGPPIPGEPAKLLLYLNQGNEQFDEYSLTVAGVENNAVSCGDFDNDTDLDLLVSGEMINAIGQMDEHTAIFRNETTNTNSPPSAPDGLTISASDTDLSLEWNPSTDDLTQQGGLSYNVRIGTQPGNMELFSALANLNDGFRRVASRGNAGSNTSWNITDLPFGEYYVSVQAIDHAYGGSNFSATESLVVIPTATFTVEDSTCVSEETVITYTGNASPEGQYEWDFDGAVIVSGSGQGPYTVYWETGGLKTVSLIVTENGISSDAYSQEVMVIEYPGTPGFIAGPTQLCQGAEDTEFYVPPVSDALEYEWSLHPPEAGSISGISTTGTVVWDPDFHGLADVSVRGSNFCGFGPWSDSLEVAVDPLPEKPSMPLGPTQLCQGSANTMYGIDAVSFANGYEWNLFPETAGVIYSNGLQAEVDWSAEFTGEAGIVVAGVNSCGPGPFSDTLFVMLAAPPIANAGVDQSIPSGTSTQLSGSATGGSGDFSYSWMPDNLVTDPDSANTNTIALTQSEQFILRVTDNVTGCIGTDEVVITVTGGPLTVDALADPDTVCPGEESGLLALAGGGSGNYTYSWTSDPPGFTADSAAPSVYPITTTTYYVTINDGNGSASDSVVVIVSPKPDPPGGIEGPMTVCAGDQNILYEIAPVANATHYYWNLDDGMYGSSDSTSILVSWDENFMASGGSIAVWSVNDCGLSDEWSLLVPLVKKIPGQPQNIIGPDTLCTTTESVTTYMLEEGVPEADEYTWQLIPAEAGYIVLDGTEANVHWEQNWEGEVLVSVKAVNSCFESDWSEPIEIWAYNCLGIKNADGEGLEVTIYPNPSDGMLHVGCRMLDEHRNLDLFVTDLFGRNLIETNHPGRGVVEINTSGIPAGMYIISLRGENGLRVSKRIVIQH